MAECFRVLDLKSGGPSRFKSSTMPLNWICFSIAPSSTPPLTHQLGFLMIYVLFVLFVYAFTVSPISTYSKCQIN